MSEEPRKNPYLDADKLWTKPVLIEQMTKDAAMYGYLKSLSVDKKCVSDLAERIRALPKTQKAFLDAWEEKSKELRATSIPDMIFFYLTRIDRSIPLAKSITGTKELIAELINKASNESKDGKIRRISGKGPTTIVEYEVQVFPDGTWKAYAEHSGRRFVFVSTDLAMALPE